MTAVPAQAPQPCPAVVSVVIPTLHRPAPLARAVASVMAQALPAGVTVDLVVVDNSADAGARAAIAALRPPPPVSLRYLSVPEPGVATARNAGVAAAAGAWIAFLDDDEEATPGWLAALIGVARGGGVDAVFGPVHARGEEGRDPGPLEPYFSRRLERRTGDDITAMAAYLGTNNSMFSREALLSVAGPFEVRLDRSGGEDSLLLRRLVMAGRRFCWAADAVITEWVPRKRLDWAYVRKRKFLSGQIRTFVHDMVEPPQPISILLWMGVGLVQFAGAGVAAAALWPFARARARRLQSTAWGGLGKVLWMRRFRPGLYGTGLVS